MAGIVKDLGAKESAKSPTVLRTFASKAYVLELERGLYGLFRDIEVETDKVGPDGKNVREKNGKIGPISLLRPCKEGEQPVMQTFDHRTNSVIELAEYDEG